MKFFLKNELRKRVTSMALAFVMVFTMFAAQLPAGLLEVKAAEGDMNITVHFDNSLYNWGEPAIQFWGGNLTPSGYTAGPTEISGWGGAQGYSLTNENNGWYSITLTGTCDGFQFVDMSNPSGNTGGKGYNANLTQYTDATAKDLYFKPYEDNYNGKWYTDAECTTELKAPETAEPAKEYDVTLHWQNIHNWDAVTCHAWGTDTFPSWPGTAATANEEKENWYDVTFEDLTSAEFNFIFNNNGAGQQTYDLKATLVEGSNELWVVPSDLTDGKCDAVVTTTAPDTWTGETEDTESTETESTEAPTASYDVVLHWENVHSWEKVACHAWGTDSFPAWPGTAATANEEKENWYDVTFEDLTSAELNFIFNNNGAGQQTYDLKATLKEDKNELWVVAGELTDGKCDAVVTETAPESWTNAEVPSQTYDVVLHWQNVHNWEAIACHAWGTDSFPTWPGTVATVNEDNTDWYDVTFTDLTSAEFNFIFNNNNNGQQTSDLKATLSIGKNELWVVGSELNSGKCDAKVSTEAPNGWMADGKMTVVSPEVNGQTVILRYYAPDAEAVYVAGQMNGWNASGDLMTKDDKGVWTYQEEFEPGTYQYKFVADGSWTTDPSNKAALVDGNNVFTVTASSSTPAEPAKSNYFVKDVMAVKIGETTYPMSVFAEGIFETVETLEAGEYTATLIANGTETAITKTFTVEKAGETVIRLTNDGLSAFEVMPAAAVGTLKTALGIGADWDPANADMELAYVGGGIYMGTLEFAALAADTELEYKVAFNDSWDYSIGDGSNNIKVTVPAGATAFTILVDEIAKVVYDDVRTEDIKVNGAGMNPFTTSVSLIGTVRGLGGDDWNAGAKGFEFTRISDTLYRYDITLDKGSHSYKAVFNYGTWYEKEGSGNRMITLTSDDVNVVILYDTESGYLYDTVNNEVKVAALLSMQVGEAKADIVENADGTVEFIGVAGDGAKVALYYGDKAAVEKKGTAALTKVNMSVVSGGKYSSGALWLGDAAVDLVYYYDVDGSRVLDASNPTVTVGDAEYSNYKKEEYKGRVVNVPGTFPGPSWDAASNVMTYTGNRTYEYTFKDVPAAKYEHKIAINGSWAENYGVGGAFEGANIKVSVPEKQDVTIYYSDVTHYAVNSIDYKFATITLTGKNVPEGTKLIDAGFTGIYSATITLPAGTYDDFVITCDGVKQNVAEFTLTEEKAVTFCMDPITGLFYHDASNEKINAEKIFFDSKDAEYKSVYGAIATGEEVTFTLATGTDVVNASFIIKGNVNKAIIMEKAGEAVDGVQKWTAKVSLDTIGEYTYYFAVSNGSSVQVYGDDDGYYGVGKVDELTSVLPYDLVVYKAGFETPDWMKNAVIYQIFPDRFYDGDASNNKAQTTARGEVDYEFVDDWYTLPENPEQEALLDKETYEATGALWGDGQWSNEIYGGDLEGITDRIEYLKALGVTVIYLNPVFSSISSHRYDACDYTKIDPVLGTEGDFTELVKVAEANGMKVVLDGVFNHVSDDSIYFDRYYKFIDDGLKTIGAYPYWAYVYDYMAEKEVTQSEAETAAKAYFTAEYGITDYSYTEWFDVFTTTLKDDAGNDVCDNIGLRAGKPVYGYDGWWGYDSMPIIKSTDGSEYQTGDWAEEIIYNAEGTSVTQYWISKGMDGWRLDVANEVSDETWQRFRESVKGLDSEAVIIGEIWDDATKYILGDMYDSVMNYMFRNAVTAFAMGTDAEATTNAMEKLRERYPEEAFYAMMNLVGSHDTTRLLSYLDGIADDRNQKDIDSAFPTYAKTSEDAKQRQYLVAFLQYTYAGAPTVYYGDEIGMVGSDDPDDRRAFEWGKGNKELVTYYATLGTIRNSYEVLRTGSVETFDAGSKNVLGYVRRDANDAMVVLANNGTAAVEVTLDLTELEVAADVLKNLLDSEASYTVSEGKVTVSVPARRGLILTDDDTVKAVTVNEAALAVAYEEKYIVDERPVDAPVVTPSVPDTDDSDDETTTPSTPATTPSTKPSTPAAKPETETPSETVDEPVEVVIPVDGTVAEKAEAIVEAIETVAAGNDVVVKVIDAESGNAEISIEVLTSLDKNKEKDVDLVIELANGFKWTIDAGSIDMSALAEGTKAIDFWVGEVENVVPAELVTEIASENQKTMEISLKHNGAFGLTAALEIPVGAEFAGRNTTLYYYNKEAGTMEGQGSAIVDDNGNVEYLFGHASDYVIVIDEEAAVTDEKVEATESVVETEKAETEAPAAEKEMNILPIIGIVALLLLAVGVVILTKKKNK